MTSRILWPRRRGLAALALLVVALVPAALPAQQLPPVPVKRAFGQSIQPVFEGWEKNADGTFNLVFGYMNRNYEELHHVAVGPNNRFEPGEADRGQPTFFYTRRRQFQFRVAVPRDWGEKELIWSVTANGQAERAYGSLSPVWELSRAVLIDNLHGNNNINLAEKDQPPVLRIDATPAVVVVGAALTLKGSAADPDGIPPAPKPRAQGLAVGRSESGTAPFLNVPLPAVERFPPGLSAGWIVYRGPAAAAIEPAGYRPIPPTGEFVTNVTFSVPGAYVLRAVASDSMLETMAEITVRVTAP